MLRLIDADKIEPTEIYNGEWVRVAYMDDIDELPTVDAVPVVRCDDCVYRDGKTPGQPNILCWQMHSDDYCSYGTKREVGTYCEDIVSVVRCKDCEFSSMPEWDSDEVYCTKHNNWFKINGYCHLGRRENVKTG